MQRLNVWKGTPLRSCNFGQKLTKWDLKAFKQEKQEDSIRWEDYRHHCLLQIKPSALNSLAGHGCVSGGTGHFPTTATLGSWVHGWRHGCRLPCEQLIEGWPHFGALSPCCLGKSTKKKRSERGLVLRYHQASQGQDGHCLSPWAGLAHVPVGTLAHVLPPVAAHKQILSFTYCLTQKEEKWIHMTVTMLTM